MCFTTHVADLNLDCMQDLFIVLLSMIEQNTYNMGKVTEKLYTQQQLQQPRHSPFAKPVVSVQHDTIVQQTMQQAHRIHTSELQYSSWSHI